MSIKRNHPYMKQRRAEAAKLFAKGVKPANIARQLKVSRQRVSRWQKLFRQGGMKRLENSTLGRPRKVSPSDIQKIEKVVIKGPRAYGIDADVWTLSRVGEVVSSISGHSYNHCSVWSLLKGLGWSRQRAAKRAAKLDKANVYSWFKETRPAVKRTRAKKVQ